MPFPRACLLVPAWHCRTRRLFCLETSNGLLGEIARLAATGRRPFGVRVDYITSGSPTYLPRVDGQLGKSHLDQYLDS